MWWCVVCRISMCQRDLEQPHTNRFPLGHRLIALHPQQDKAAVNGAVERKRAAGTSGGGKPGQQPLSTAASTAVAPFTGLTSPATATEGESQLHQQVHAALLHISEQRVVEERLRAAKRTSRLGLGRVTGRSGALSFLDTPSNHQRFLPVLNKADLQQHWESLLEDVKRLYPMQGTHPTRSSAARISPPQWPPSRLSQQQDGPLPLGHILPIAPRRIEGRSASAISPTLKRTVLARLTSSTSPAASPLPWSREDEEEERQRLEVHSRQREESHGRREFGEHDEASAQGSSDGPSGSEVEEGQEGNTEREREEDVSSTNSSASVLPSHPPPHFYHSAGQRSMDDAMVSSQRPHSPRASASSALVRRSRSSATLSTSVFVVELPVHPLDLLHRSQSSPARQLDDASQQSEDTADSAELLDSSPDDSPSKSDLQEVEQELADGSDGQGLPPAPGPLRSVQFTDANGVGRWTEEENGGFVYVDERAVEEMRGGGSAHEFDSGVEQSESALIYELDDGRSGEASEDNQRGEASAEEAQSEPSVAFSSPVDDYEDAAQFAMQPLDKHSRLLPRGAAHDLVGPYHADSPLLAADSERDEDAARRLSEEEEIHEELEGEVEDDDEALEADAALEEEEVEEEVHTPNSIPPSQGEAANERGQLTSDGSPSRQAWSSSPSPAPSSLVLHPTPLAAYYHAQRSPAMRSSDELSYRTSPLPSPTPSPFDDDEDLNDALRNRDDDGVEQLRVEQEERRQRRQHRPSHSSLSPSAPPADGRRGHRVLLSAFHRVLDHLDDYRPSLSAPVDDDVQLVARLLQRLLDGPVDRWRESSGISSSPSSRRGGSLREREAYDGYGRAGHFTSSGSASYPRVSPPQHRRPRASPPVQPVSMTQARRAPSDDDLLRAYPSPPLAGLHPPPSSPLALQPSQSPLLGSSIPSLSPSRSARESRSARSSRPHRHHAHTHDPLHHPRSTHHLHPQQAAATSKTPKASSHSSHSVHQQHAPPSSRALNASHGGLARLTHGSADLPLNSNSAEPVPHVTVTGPRAISVRLGGKGRREERPSRPSILQAMEEQNRRAQRREKERRDEEEQWPGGPHRIDHRPALRGAGLL